MYRELETQPDVVTYVKAMLLIHREGITAYFPTDADFEDAFRTRDRYQRFSKRASIWRESRTAIIPRSPSARVPTKSSTSFPRPSWRLRSGSLLGI